MSSSGSRGDTTLGAQPLATTVFSGRGWYVDAALGNDSNPGTISQPWKTLAAVALGKYATADAVLLKCGGIWRESLTLTNGNAPAGNLTVGVYGTCNSSNLPVISGADVVSGTWQVASGFGSKPVYSTTVAQPVSALFWNGTPLVKARYPNYGGITNEFSFIGQVVNSKTFKLAAADAAALGSGSLAGATAYIRTAPYAIEAIPIASNNPADGSIVLASAPVNSLQAQQGFYIEGKLGLLGAAGEWYQDPTTGSLYVWLPGGAVPSSGLLESVQRSTGLAMINIPDAKVDQLVLTQQSTTTLRTVGSKRTIFSSVVIKNALRDGILIDGGTTSSDSSGSQITGANISGAGSNAIIVKSPGSSVTNSQIDATGIGPIYTGVNAGINVLADSAVIQTNRITRSGLRAIELGAVAGGTVSGNNIAQACMRLTDCGAIYAYGTPTGSTRTSITSNAISNMVPNPVGAVGGATTLVAGIYLDEASSLLDVVNNMISSVDTGIKLHDASNNTVQSNSVWLTATASLVMHSSNATTEMVRGNLIASNLLYAANTLVPQTGGNGLPVRKVVPPQQWMHSSNAASMFTGTNPNVVRNNIAGTMSSLGKVFWQLTSGSTTTSYNVQQWASFATGEQIQMAYPAVDLVATQSGPELVQNIGLGAPGTPWQTWMATAPVPGIVNFGTCSTGCANFVPGTKYDALMSSTFSMNSTSGNSLYLLHLKATAMVPMTSLYAGTNRLSDGANIGISSGFTLVSFEQSSYTTLFYAKTSDPAHLVINGIAGQGFQLASIGAYQISSYTLFSPIGETALLTNETSNFKSVTCAAAGLRTCVASDLKGHPISWPVMLAANSSLAVVTADATWKPAN